MSNSLMESISDMAVHAALPKLNDTVKSMARTAGWPNSICKVLSVSYKDRSVKVVYPESLDSEVNDLEYGTPSTPPKAVIRKFNLRIESLMSKSIENAIYDSIDKLAESA